MFPELFERDELADAIEVLHDATAWYTAEPVAEQLLDMVAWHQEGRRTADVSCGDGQFLVSALRRLLVVRPSLTPQDVLFTLQGWEIHPQAAAEARRRLAAVLVEHGWPAHQAHRTGEAMVVHADFLKEGPTVPTWDVAVGNPPFISYQRLPSILRSHYERSLPAYSTGDMLHSFIARCAQTLLPGGEVSIVASDRFLFSKGASELREVVGRRYGIHHLQRLDCTSAFYRPKIRRAGQPPRVHPVALVLREARLCARPLTRDPVYPDALDTVSAHGPTLNDVAHIRLAPWLGKHGLFVVGKEVASKLPPEVLVPAIDTDDIKGGVMSAPTRFAIKTYRGVEPCKTVLEHLDAHMHLLARTKRRTDNRWVPPEPFVHLDLSKPSLLVPRIASSLKPVRIPPGVLPLDHGISIVTAGAATLDDIEQALQRPEANAWVRSRAPRLEGGYHSLTTTLLRQLPVKLPSSDEATA